MLQPLPVSKLQLKESPELGQGQLLGRPLLTGKLLTYVPNPTRRHFPGTQEQFEAPMNGDSRTPSHQACELNKARGSGHIICFHPHNGLERWKILCPFSR